jgi:hemerythrin superfamily protein
MAQTKRKSTGQRKTSGEKQQTKRKASAKRNGNGAGKTDAIALLKQDHREVEEWFAQFEKSRSESKKRDLAQKICMALTAHTMIEEEIFYPAFLEATDETDIHHEAEIEHDGAKKLIAQIQSSDPTDDYFDARVTVLSEMIKHHVKEEEKRDGMFAKAKQADMDMKALGEELQSRKKELMGDKNSLARMAQEAGAATMMAGRKADRGQREAARSA